MIGRILRKIPFIGPNYAVIRSYITSYTLNCYFLKRFTTNSLSFLQSEESLRAEIDMNCHIIEKGLTMPEMRMAFGQPVIQSLIAQIERYVKLHGSCDCSVTAAVATLKEYLQLHDSNSEISVDFRNRLQSFVQGFPEIALLSQPRSSKKDFFANAKAEFSTFAKSRHSVRDLSGEVSVDKIRDAIQTALHSPSSCNRQAWILHLVSSKPLIDKALKFQNGNRGFSHLVNKLLVVTVDARALGYNEFRDVFVNGGLFTMSMVYALHSMGVANCLLNWSVTKENDIGLRRLLKIKESEMIIVMIGCGDPPDFFKYTNSKRKQVDEVLVIH